MIRRIFLSLPFVGFLFKAPNKVVANAVIPKTSKEEPLFWEKLPTCNEPNSIWNRLTDELKADIENQVLEWLEIGESPNLDLYLRNESGSDAGLMVFVLSEINIRNCINEWDVWRIATASNCPKIFSRKIKTIGSNSATIDVNFSLPSNEVKSFLWDWSKKQKS